MKNLITTLVTLVIVSSSMYATISPDGNLPAVEVYDLEVIDFISNSDFDSNTGSIYFDTKVSVSVMQIYNNNQELVFQLPVMSKEITLNKNLFDTGEYNLGFLIEGSSEIKFTKLVLR